MRVNIEDDLRASGRLSKLARVMCWSDREALGALVMFWRSTQDAEIVTAAIDEIVTACVVDFDSDEEAVKFINALVSARLADRTDDGKIHLRGQEQHVSRVVQARTNGHRGGRKKNNDFVGIRLPDRTNPVQSAKPPAPAPTDLKILESTNAEISLRARALESPLVGTNHPEVQFFEAAYRERFKGPSFTPKERAQAYQVIRACGEVKVAWKDVLAFYASAFDFSGHTIDWLARNLREVLNKRQKPNKAVLEVSRHVVPSAAESKRFLEQAEKHAAEASSPEAIAKAQEALSALKTKFKY